MQGIDTTGIAEAPVVQVTSPAPVTIWREVLRADPDATAQQLPEYAAAVCALGGTDASRLYSLADGRRIVVPLIRRPSVPGLARECGFPTGCGHGGLLADGGVRASDVRAVVADLQRRRAWSVALDGHHQTSERWSGSGVAGWDRVNERHRRVDVVDLSQGFDRLWSSGLDRTVRANVRKAERRGVEVLHDPSAQATDRFYQTYLAWVEERLASSVLPAPVARAMARRRDSIRKVRAVTSELGEACRVYLAWHDGRPVAASIMLVHGSYAIGWRTASIKALAGPLAANTALHVTGLRDAAAAGVRYFDLGQSSDAPGLLAYKHSLGGRPRQVVDLRIEPSIVTRWRSVGARGFGKLERALARHPLRLARK